MTLMAILLKFFLNGDLIRLKFIFFCCVFFMCDKSWADHIPSESVLKKIEKLNQQGRISEAWNLLSQQGDSYASKAYLIFADNISIEHCVLFAHWKNVVGEKALQENFYNYGKAYQRKYILFSEKNKRLPNTNEIENIYAEQIDEMGFPRSLAIDLVLNQVPNKSLEKIASDLGTSMIGYGGVKLKKNWYDFVGITKERISKKKTISNLNANEARELIFKDQVIAIEYCLKNIVGKFSRIRLTGDSSCNH
jgi:hypothetical protein